jgi:hypothetical protein
MQLGRALSMSVCQYLYNSMIVTVCYCNAAGGYFSLGAEGTRRVGKSLNLGILYCLILSASSHINSQLFPYQKSKNEL